MFSTYNTLKAIEPPKTIPTTTRQISRTWMGLSLSAAGLESRIGSDWDIAYSPVSSDLNVLVCSHAQTSAATMARTAPTIAICPRIPKPDHFESNTAMLPGNRRAGAQISADATLAIQNWRGGIFMMPAISGTEARNGPKNRPMKTLAPPKRRNRASPWVSNAGFFANGQLDFIATPKRSPSQ